MRIQTELIGVNSVLNELDKCLDNPPHIFLVGLPGTGKTTIAKDFIRAYFAHHKISKNQEAELFIEISSHQDRGIHTFRQILNDHVRWIAPRNDLYRWVIIDDCDTLPAISQQALRRPMETFDHITRFLFISQNQETLITPLQSRCHIILVEPTLTEETFQEILYREGFPKNSVNSETCSELMSLSLGSIMKFQSLARMLYSLKCNEQWDTLTIDYIKKSFDTHIWGTMTELLDTLIEGKWALAQRYMYKIWELGYSFEDILFELEHGIIVMNIVDHRAWYNIQQFLIKSWIYHSQSRSGILDLMTACGEIEPWHISSALKA